MIIEFFQSLRSSAPRYARAMGYVRESTAIRARYKRCSKAWESHIIASRALCLEAVAQCLSFDHCVVIGAGLLFDVPLAELAQQFQRVTLIDIVFSDETRMIVDSFANVRCCEWDITGCVNAFFDAVEYSATSSAALALPPPQNALREIVGDTRIDCIISASILSQLAVMPKLYAEQRGVYQRLPESAWKAWETSLMIGHVQNLQSQGQCVCIMFDQERMILKQSRTTLAHVQPDWTIIDRESAMGELPSDALYTQVQATHPHMIQREWLWEIAPPGEEHKNYCVRHRVGGVVAWQSLQDNKGEKISPLLVE